MTKNLSAEKNESNQRRLERFSEKKYTSYEAAATAKAVLTSDPMTDTTKKLIEQTAKAKIFARYDGTFDLALHSWTEPVERVISHTKVTNAAVLTPRFGERVDIRAPAESTSWWR